MTSNSKLGSKRKMKLSEKPLAMELKYALYIIFRPIAGYWDLKHERRGSFKAAMVILCIALFTFVLMERYTAFLFNPVNLLEVNLFREMATFLSVFWLFVVSGWCLTTLMDGKGTMKDIAIATAYALTPFIIINIPLVFISNYLTLQESAFYHLFMTISFIWTGGLIIFGTMVTHEYTMFKTIMTLVLIILGMLIMLFLFLLFFSVIQRMIGLIYVLYQEISFRM